MVPGEGGADAAEPGILAARSPGRRPDPGHILDRDDFRPTGAARDRERPGGNVPAQDAECFQGAGRGPVNWVNLDESCLIAVHFHFASVNGADEIQTLTSGYSICNPNVGSPH